MAYHPMDKLKGRRRRRIRVRKKVFGTEQRPRLSVFRSAKHIYAQVIDDENRVTVAAASTVHKSVRDDLEGKKTDRAKKVGEVLAAQCKEQNVDQVVFDRAGYKYHGRVKAVAEGARTGGLKL